MERFGGTHQLQLALDGHAALILGAQQQRPRQRRAEVARPAVDHVAHHQQHEHAGEVAFFPACRAFFRREEKGRDARRGECYLLDEAEAGAAQDGKAVEHGGRCGSQQQEIPGLSREFEFHIVPPARRKGAGSPHQFLEFFKYYNTFLGVLCYNKENSTQIPSGGAHERCFFHPSSRSHSGLYRISAV